MTNIENRQRIKNEALNSIREIYDPKRGMRYFDYCDENFAEQREYKISEIIKKMEKDLININIKK